MANFKRYGDIVLTFGSSSSSSYSTPFSGVCDELWNTSNGPYSETVFRLLREYGFPDEAGISEGIVENGELKFIFPAPESDYYYYSNEYLGTYEFLGECDFSIDIRIAPHPVVGDTNTNGEVLLTLGYYGGTGYGGTGPFYMGFDWWGNTEGESFCEYNVESQIGNSGYGTTLPEGTNSAKLRIRRDESGNIYGYAWNIALARWEWEGNTAGTLLGVDNSPLSPMFYTYTGTPTNLYLDNFVVDSGCGNAQYIENRIVIFGYPSTHKDLSILDFIETSDGEYIAIGCSYNYDTSDEFLAAVKFTLESNTVTWDTQYPIDGYLDNSGYGGWASSIVETTGGYIILSKELNTTTYCVSDYLIKIDTSGNLLWSKMLYTEISDSFPSQIKNTSDGGFIYLSSQFIDPSGNGNPSDETEIPVLVKLNSSGEISWTKWYVTPWATHNYVEQTSDGGYITGISESVDGVKSPIIIKVDSSGNRTWGRKITRDLPHSDAVIAIHQTVDGGYILLTAGDNYYGEGGTVSDGVIISKLTSTGDITWAKVVTDAQTGVTYADNPQPEIIEVADGYVFCCLDLLANPIVVKLDLTGSLVWSSAFDLSPFGVNSGYSPKIKLITDGIGVSFYVSENNNNYSYSVFSKMDLDGTVPGCSYCASTTVTITTSDSTSTVDTVTIVSGDDTMFDPLAIKQDPQDITFFTLCPPSSEVTVLPNPEFIYIQQLGSESTVGNIEWLGKNDENYSNIVLASAGQDKIYKSTDQGSSWDLAQELGVYEIGTILSLESGIVLAAVVGVAPSYERSIYKSVNSGNTWNFVQLLGGIGSSTETMTYLGSGVVLAGTTWDANVYKSTDYGDTWNLVQQLGSNNFIWSLCDLGAGVVLASASTTSTFTSIYKSVDSGNTWSLMQHIDDVNLTSELISLGDGVVLFGTDTGEIYKSVDSGDTWTSVYILEIAGHATIEDMVYSVSTNEIYFGLDGTSKIYKSIDLGETWNLIQILGGTTNNMESIAYVGNDIVLAGTANQANIWMRPTQSPG